MATSQCQYFTNGVTQCKKSVRKNSQGFHLGLCGQCNRNLRRSKGSYPEWHAGTHVALGPNRKVSAPLFAMANQTADTPATPSKAPAKPVSPAGQPMPGTVTVWKNPQFPEGFGDVIIDFPGMPDEGTRTALKGLRSRFHWHMSVQKKVWFIYSTKLQEGLELDTVSQCQQIANNATTNGPWKRKSAQPAPVVAMAEPAVQAENKALKAQVDTLSAKLDILIAAMGN